MHGHGRDDLDRRIAHFAALAFNLDQRPAAAHIQQLKQVSMAVRLDLPVVQAAALGDGLAVQQVRRRPGLILAVQLEHRNAGEVGSCHCGQPAGGNAFDNRTKYVKVQFTGGISPFFTVFVSKNAGVHNNNIFRVLPLNCLEP
ncbi:hypothetical protein D3C76_999960 [compost metagenome]